MKLLGNKQFSFSAIYFFGWGALATYAMDFVFYSERVGFTNTEIGAIFASKMLIAILFQPFFGFICDYLRSTRKILIIMGIAAVILSACLPAAPSKLSILIIDFVFTFFICAFMPLFDNWVACECVNEKKFHYGTIRLWGSAGYAIVCILYGRMTMYTDVAYIFYGRAVFFAITVLFVFLNSNEVRCVTIKEKEEKPQVKILFSKPEYWLFFIFIFLFCLPINAVNALFPRLLLDKGSTNQTIALFSSINAFVEIPFFLLLSKVNKKTGSRGLMLIGSLFVVLRLIGFTFADSIPMLMLSYICVIPYICFFLPGFIFYSRSIAPKNTEAFTLTSLQGMAMGFSGMLGNYVGGLIIDSRGIRTMYLYYTIVCITGIILFLITSWWLKRRAAAL